MKVLKKSISIIVLATSLFVVAELIPHSHLKVNKDIVKSIITYSIAGNVVSLETSSEIRILTFFINHVKFFDSDLPALQSSPEKCIIIECEDGTEYQILNSGAYFLIAHTQMLDGNISFVEDGKIYMSDLFVIDRLYFLSSCLKKIGKLF